MCDDHWSPTTSTSDPIICSSFLPPSQSQTDQLRWVYMLYTLLPSGDVFYLYAGEIMNGKMSVTPITREICKANRRHYIKILGFLFDKTLWPSVCRISYLTVIRVVKQSSSISAYLYKTLVCKVSCFHIHNKHWSRWT